MRVTFFHSVLRFEDNNSGAFSDREPVARFIKWPVRGLRDVIFVRGHSEVLQHKSA